MFTVQAREEHLDKLIGTFWLDETTPGDDDLATPIKDNLLMDKISRSLKQLTSGLPCLWKTKHPNITNNYNMCKNRLVSLLSSKLITTTTQLLRDHNDIFKKWEEKGYIEQVLDPYPRRQGVWYAQHFPVLRMQKDTSKIRPVFDCAAKTKGVCLNDFLTQGPQVMTTDMAEMFLRVQVAEEDRDYLRFLIFGKTDSPCIAMRAVFTQIIKQGEVYPGAYKNNYHGEFSRRHGQLPPNNSANRSPH
jgi:hypothetical protein